MGEGLINQWGSSSGNSCIFSIAWQLQKLNPVVMDTFKIFTLWIQGTKNSNKQINKLISWKRIALHLQRYLCFLYCLTELQMTKWLRLEGTSAGHLVQPACSSKDN